MAHSKKTSLQIGLVTIPVRLEVAVDDESSGLRTICTGTDESHDPTRVKMHVDCPTCQRSHSSVWGYAERGVERDGKLVVLTAEEIAAAAGDPIKAMELTFHHREKAYAGTVDGGSVQNVIPDKGGEKAYAGLLTTMRANPDLVAATVWAPATKNALWFLEHVDGRLVATKRAWPEDVRPAPAIPTAELSDVELAMIGQVVDVYTTDFDVTTYRDLARTGLDELITSRVGDAPVAAVGSTASATAGDILAQLQATLDAAKPKKPAAKKAPAKRAAAKRAPAKNKVA